MEQRLFLFLLTRSLHAQLSWNRHPYAAGCSRIPSHRWHTRSLLRCWAPSYRCPRAVFPNCRADTAHAILVIWIPTLQMGVLERPGDSGCRGCHARRQYSPRGKLTFRPVKNLWHEVCFTDSPFLADFPLISAALAPISTGHVQRHRLYASLPQFRLRSSVCVSGAEKHTVKIRADHIFTLDLMSSRPSSTI